MKKNRCYPKYSYILYIILAIIMFILSCTPLFVFTQTNDGIAIKIIWSILMIFFGIICAIGALQNMQYYFFENGHIVVKSFFGIIIKLDIHNVHVYIENLPTYSSWAVTSYKKWICIYDKDIHNATSSPFKSGCSNKKKKKKIQIIYNEKNVKNIEQYLKIKKYQDYVDEIYQKKHR